MRTKELMWIREKSKEFQDKFGKRLVIDYSEMNGAVETAEYMSNAIKNQMVEEYYNKCVEKYSPNLEYLKNRRSHKYGMEKEQLFMMDFCRYVMKNKLSATHAGRLLSKNRATVFYHGLYKEIC